ncbi:MAG: hypothetical protein V4513_03245 [Pseudomonadota bacterium]
MFTTLLFIVLLAIPAIVLFYRTVVSKQKVIVRAGAGAAAMLTLVGAFVMPRFALGQSDVYRLSSMRDGLALLAAASGPLYLLFWSRKHRGRGRSRTISIIAAIVGLVPIVATLAIAMIYAGER